MKSNLSVASIAMLAALLPTVARSAVRVGSSAEVALAERKAAEPVLSVECAKPKISLTRGKTGTIGALVRNTGGGRFNWSVASTPKWLAVAPVEGSISFGGTEALVLTVDSSGLALGTVTGTVTLQAPDAADPRASFEVTVTVAAPKEESKDLLKDLAGEIKDDGAPSLEDNGRDQLPLRRLPNKRKGSFGFLAGVTSALGGRSDALDGGRTLAVFWRSPIREGKLDYELQIGYGTNDLAGNLGSTSRTSGAASALFYLVSRPGTRVYALAGMSVLSETVSDVELGDTTSMGAKLDFGIGATFKKRFDARIEYSILLGSENLSGVIGLLAGVVF